MVPREIMKVTPEDQQEALTWGVDVEVDLVENDRYPFKTTIRATEDHSGDAVIFEIDPKAQGLTFTGLGAFIDARGASGIRI